ncbi:MAG: DUF2891 domain-containing protein [Planctomycetota bacterium]
MRRTSILLLVWLQVTTMSHALDTDTDGGLGAPSKSGRGGEARLAARFADLALSCVHREYPNKIAHVLSGVEDAKTPRQLTPIFYGCFDWHSAVHGHWLLVRLLRRHPKSEFATKARAALRASFRDDAAAVELAYLKGKGRTSFERPYGLAWLLQLHAELVEWKDDADARKWKRTLDPIAKLAAQRFLDWFPKLSHPIRTGEHSQTAFAMGLVLDWARTTGHEKLEALVVRRSLDYYSGDRRWNLAFEPGGQDFLSPGLAEADLMRRVLPADDFASWLDGFLPELRRPKEMKLEPVVVTEKADGKLAHLDGLNLSRAWMLDGIVEGLPKDDPRRATLEKAAQAHRRAGIAAVDGEHYEGGHWLGSFAVYLVSARGLRSP